MKKTPLRKVSKKQSKRLTEYAWAKKKYMEDHPYCESHMGFGEVIKATQLHHKKGRGIYLADPSYFAALCSACHSFIHEHPNWARDAGWLIR